MRRHVSFWPWSAQLVTCEAATTKKFTLSLHGRLRGWKKKTSWVENKCLKLLGQHEDNHWPEGEQCKTEVTPLRDRTIYKLLYEWKQQTWWDKHHGGCGQQRLVPTSGDTWHWDTEDVLFFGCVFLCLSERKTNVQLFMHVMSSSTWPTLVEEESEAPFSSNMVATSWCPSRAARWRGV